MRLLRTQSATGQVRRNDSHFYSILYGNPYNKFCHKYRNSIFYSSVVRHIQSNATSSFYDTSHTSPSRRHFELLYSYRRNTHSIQSFQETTTILQAKNRIALLKYHLVHSSFDIVFFARLPFSPFRCLNYTIKM